MSMGAKCAAKSIPYAIERQQVDRANTMTAIKCSSVKIFAKLAR